MGLMRKLTCFGFGAVLALGACSGGSETALSQAGQLKTIYTNFRAATAKAPPLPTLTPALIDSLTVSSLEIVIEERGATAYLVPFSDRNDRRPGKLRTWRTADNANLVFRDGILVTTRGLGNDLGSSDASSTVAAIQTRSARSGQRAMFVRNGDNGTDRINLSCTMSNLGPTTLSIVGTQRSVVHLQESCIGSNEQITNDFWVDRRDSTVWQSRQWASPELGYIRTRLLKK